MSRRGLTDYDRRQLSIMRRILEQSLRHIGWMEEKGRSPEDRELRAMNVSGSTAYVSQLAKNFQRRWEK